MPYIVPKILNILNHYWALEQGIPRIVQSLRIHLAPTLTLSARTPPRAAHARKVLQTS